MPRLDRLHERHPGLTKPVSEAYAEAAYVLLDQFHEPPVDASVGVHDGPNASYQLDWEPTGARQRRAHGNQEDATRDGAYSLVLASAEVHLDLVATTRLMTGTGADYLLDAKGTIQADIDELNLETALRLEVSGIRYCDSAAVLARRLNQKVDQARRGRSSLPAIAGVAAFSRAQVRLRQV